MSLIGFKAQNHPQQVGPRGFFRKDMLPGLGEHFPAEAADLTDNVDDRAVPEGLFADWQMRFRFTLDAAASHHNAKLPRYHTMENSGLEAAWSGERIYCNPPFSDIEPWVEKAWLSTASDLVVMLLPANRTEQKWWQGHIEEFRDGRDDPDGPLTVEFLSGRIKFLSPGQTSIEPNNRPPFGCCLCIWEWEKYRAKKKHREVFGP